MNFIIQLLSVTEQMRTICSHWSDYQLVATGLSPDRQTDAGPPPVKQVFICCVRTKLSEQEVDYNSNS